MCFMTDYSFSQFILNTENMCRSVVKRQSLKQFDQDVRLNFKLIVPQVAQAHYESPEQHYPT